MKSDNLLDKVLEAQERCAPSANPEPICGSCPYSDDGNLCMEHMRRDTIDMLQRVKNSRIILEKVKETNVEEKPEIKVEILRAPTQADWLRCLTLARATQGKSDAVKVPTTEWKEKIIRSGHSPIRTLMWTIRIENIPYCNSVHFVRHKIGVEHYVQSQRKNEDRGAERQDAPVTHIMDINAQALIEMSHKRLCTKADQTTRKVMKMICKEVALTVPEMACMLHPTCVWNPARCPEFEPCMAMGEFEK